MYSNRAGSTLPARRSWKVGDDIVGEIVFYLSPESCYRMVQSPSVPLLLERNPDTDMRDRQTLSQLRNSGVGLAGTTLDWLDVADSR